MACLPECVEQGVGGGSQDSQWARRDPDIALLHDESEFECLYPDNPPLPTNAARQYTDLISRDFRLPGQMEHPSPQAADVSSREQVTQPPTAQMRRYVRRIPDGALPSALVHSALGLFS
jgi:hypothetical protein